ncbi:MAG: mechanosensitive ion channel [Bacilli bacterium]|nr:mechanosensitive ion channel [Bacilli bacterium]
MDNFLAWIKEQATQLIITGIIILLVLLILFIMNLIVNRFVRKHKRKRAITVAKLIQSIVRYSVIIIGIIAIIGTWGIDVKPVLAGAGIIGLAVGLGAQSLIRDFLAGISIVFENHYDVDDVIEVKGFKGKVIEIGLRSTRIQNWLGDVKIVANGDITEVVNYSKNPSIGVAEFEIDYQENLEKVLKILEERIVVLNDTFPQIIEGPTIVGIIKLGVSSQTIRITAKTISEEHYAVERGIYKFVKELFEEYGIKGPHQRMIVKNDK